MMRNEEPPASLGKRAAQTLVFIVFAIAIYGIFRGEPTEAELAERAATEAAQRDALFAAMATQICRDAIEDRLVAPATAEHPFFAQSVERLSFDVYSVTSHVDSQNAFGALLRTRYRCELRHSRGTEPGDRQNWSLVAIHTSN